MTPARDDDRDRLIDRLIDRLVDGELPEADRRALLARLDAEPGGDGWRRCALAFLEAQAWHDAFGPAAENASETRTVATPRPAAAPRRVARLAWAAAVAGAFALGWLAHPGPGATTVAVVPAPHAAPVPAPAIAPAPESEFEEEQIASVDDGPGPGVAAEVPLSGALLADWQRQGYEILRSRRTVSLGPEGGRGVPVAVDEVRLRYVGDRTY